MRKTIVAAIMMTLITLLSAAEEQNRQMMYQCICILKSGVASESYNPPKKIVSSWEESEEQALFDAEAKYCKYLNMHPDENDGPWSEDYSVSYKSKNRSSELLSRNSVREDLEIHVGKPQCPKCKSLEKGYSNKHKKWFCQGCDYVFTKAEAAQIRSSSKSGRAGQAYAEYTEAPACPECSSLKKKLVQGYVFCRNCDYMWSEDPGRKNSRETIKRVCPNGCSKKFFKHIGDNEETLMEIWKCSKCGEKTEFPFCAE